MKTINGNGGSNGSHPVLQNLLVVLGATTLLLLVPLIAMQFTNEFTWGLFDFVAAGVLLAGTGCAYVIASSKMTNPRHRKIIGVLLALVLLGVWAELAVGIFD